MTSQLEKEFVNYDLSLRMKQLGFDGPCFGVYFNPTQELFIGKKVNEYTEDVRTSAPLFQQAFRWFRENHGLCIVIKPIDDKKLELGYNLTKNGLIMSAHLTYEKAEIACLEKLIEIVEKQKA
jgi:hypothetical protein